MSDYKQTLDAAGNVTSQYSQMLRNLDDDDLVKQLCDTIDDLTRRHQHALHKIDVLEDIIEKLEAKLARAVAAIEEMQTASDAMMLHIARITIAELKGQDDA
jgi:hypothetical protein